MDSVGFVCPHEIQVKYPSLESLCLIHRLNTGWTLAGVNFFFFGLGINKNATALPGQWHLIKSEEGKE